MNAHAAMNASAPNRPRRGFGLAPLTLDSSCCNRANWRAELPPRIDPETMEALLADKGYQPRCRHAALRVLRHPGGHELAWVVRSGRVQIRVDLTVPQNERQARAELLYADLVACLNEMSS